MKKNNIYSYLENSIEQLPMKIRIIPTVVSLIAFVIITLSYSEFRAKADGADLIGFPWYFYRYTPGGIPIDPGVSTWEVSSFYKGYFILDLLAFGIFICLFNYLFEKWRKKS